AATHLGAKARVPHELRGEHASIVGAGHREVRLERGEIVGLLPRLAECATDPGLAEPGNPPPELLADHPAPAHLWVELVAHLRPEGAVPVFARRGGEVQPILPGELLLHVAP